MLRSLIVVLTLSAVSGCGASQPPEFTLANLHDPEQLTLFSIDGRDPEAPGDRRLGAGVPKSVGEFHGYPVLGHIDVDDADLRNSLLAALRDGVARHPQEPAKCSWPRHGIRVVKNEMAVEYVICFECLQIQEFVAGNKPRYGLINPDVQSVFDKPLQDAGIPLAPL
jgi:hypothetical protein